MNSIAMFPVKVFLFYHCHLNLFLENLIFIHPQCKINVKNTNKNEKTFSVGTN